MSWQIIPHLMDDLLLCTAPAACCRKQSLQKRCEHLEMMNMSCGTMSLSEQMPQLSVGMLHLGIRFASSVIIYTKLPPKYCSAYISDRSVESGHNGVIVPQREI